MEAKITVLISEELRRQVKTVTALRGETISDVVRSALEMYVEKAATEGLKPEKMLEQDSVLSLRFNSGYTDTAERAEELLKAAVDPITGFRVD